ncbi:hypothetical protein C3477_22545 [Mycobacterium kansasii]|nr:hypothetical protein C3B43_05920 [Mycobacterium kansasii]POX99320.1 hypothetical protein C3477_22545 [Mycobacterium kansasii]POY14315.1 hypothetical protein C3476_26570 [Mycobacterium kansasii]
MSLRTGDRGVESASVPTGYQLGDNVANPLPEAAGRPAPGGQTIVPLLPFEPGKPPLPPVPPKPPRLGVNDESMPPTCAAAVAKRSGAAIRLDIVALPPGHSMIRRTEVAHKYCERDDRSG